MNWKQTSYRCWTAGDYAITGHPVMTEPGGWFFIAWHHQSELGTFDTADQAKARCAEHAEAP